MVDALPGIREGIFKKPKQAVRRAVGIGNAATLHLPEKSTSWWRKNIRPIRAEKALEVPGEFATSAREHILRTREEMEGLSAEVRRPFIETQLVGVAVLNDRLDEISSKTGEQNYTETKPKAAARRLHRLMELSESSTQQDDKGRRKIDSQGKFVDGPVRCGGTLSLSDGTTATFNEVKVKGGDNVEHTVNEVVGRGIKNGNMFLCKVDGTNTEMELPIMSVLQTQLLVESGDLRTLFTPGPEQEVFDSYTGALRDPESLQFGTPDERKEYMKKVARVGKSYGLLTAFDYEDAVKRITKTESGTPPEPNAPIEKHDRWDLSERLLAKLHRGDPLNEVYILDGNTVGGLLDETFQGQIDAKQLEISRISLAIENAESDEQLKGLKNTKAERARELRGLQLIHSNRDILYDNFDSVQAGGIPIDKRREIAAKFAAGEVHGGLQSVIEEAAQFLREKDSIQAENTRRAAVPKESKRKILMALLLAAIFANILNSKLLNAGDDRGPYG